MRKCISWATLALFAVVLGFWMTAAASAEIIQPGSEGKDAEVLSRSAGDWDDRNFGEREHLRIRGDTYQNRRYHFFIRFDVSGLSEDVASAKFSVLSYAEGGGNPNVDRTIGLYEVTEDWTEGTGEIPADGVTYNAQPSFDSTPLATITVPAGITGDEADNGGVWHVWDSVDVGNGGFAALVDEWIDGTKTNYGLMIMLTEPESTTGTPAHTYHSSDYMDNPSLRPMLEVTPVPEPGCIALLLCGMASLLFLARRRL